MIPVTKMREIAEALLKKSRADQVNWQLAKSAFATILNRSYVIKLPQSSVEIEYFSPKSEPDSVRISIRNNSGNVVGSLTAEEGDEDWDRLRDLHSEAERRVTGWDEALSDIEKSIKADVAVGLPPAKVTF